MAGFLSAEGGGGLNCKSRQTRGFSRASVTIPRLQVIAGLGTSPVVMRSATGPMPSPPVRRIVDGLSSCDQAQEDGAGSNRAKVRRILP